MFPLTPLRLAARGNGAIAMPSMRDGTVRYYRLLQQMPNAPNQFLGEFTLYMAVDALGVADSNVTVTQKGLRLGDQLEIPLRPNGTFRINWLGREQRLRYISYYKVLQHITPAEFFKDKYVFLGTSASGLQDLKSVPSQDSKMPGVEVHAVAFLNLINGTLMTEYNAWQLLWVFALAGFLLIVLYQRLKPAYGLIAMFVFATLNVFGFVIAIHEGMQLLTWLQHCTTTSRKKKRRN
jgi:CHASE2 domain-containing sensor protein